MTFHAGKNDLDVSLLDRYCAGVASSADVARIEAWFREHPEQRHRYEQFKRELRNDRVPVSPEIRHAAWRNLIHLRPEIEGKLSGRQTRRSSVFMARTLPWGVAAIATIVTIVVLGWNAGVHRMTQRATFAPTVYATANGQRANITLPDGNTVSLDVASRLEVPADYPSGNHTVHLSGEALFTVAHHDDHPLTVVSGTATTRVLGTSFLVRHYATDRATTVAVRDGKVMVHGAAVPATIVTAAQQVVVTRTGTPQVQPADTNAFAFTGGVLKISGLPLRDAIVELDRWYDADIRLADPTLGDHLVQISAVTGSLEDVASMLSFMFDVRVVRNGRVITMFPKR